DLAARADVTLALDSATGRVEADLEQVFMQVHDIDLHNHIDMRFGKLWPELFSFTPQALGGDYWLYTRPAGGNGWQLAGRQGVEARATFLWGRARAVLGGAGAPGAFGQSYDAWARVAYKLGGLRYDGVSDDPEPKPGGPL